MPEQKDCLTCRYAFPAGISTIYCEAIGSPASVVVLFGGKLCYGHDNRELGDCPAWRSKQGKNHDDKA